MPDKLKLLLNAIGRKLVMIGYSGDDAYKTAMHQLKLEVQQQRKEISRLSIHNTVLKCKVFMVKL
jgi:hypothetical protein